MGRIPFPAIHNCKAGRGKHFVRESAQFRESAKIQKRYEKLSAIVGADNLSFQYVETAGLVIFL